jgi:hypothetical protein
LVAAHQNIANAKEYLKSNIKSLTDFPHWNEDDLKKLKSLVDGVFQDLLSPQKQKNFLDVLQELEKKMANSNEWFDQVSRKKFW